MRDSNQSDQLQRLARKLLTAPPKTDFLSLRPTYSLTGNKENNFFEMKIMYNKSSMSYQVHPVICIRLISTKTKLFKFVLDNRMQLEIDIKVSLLYR